MSDTVFFSLLTGKLPIKEKQEGLENVPAGYVGNFYRKIANNVDNFLGSVFLW